MFKDIKTIAYSTMESLYKKLDGKTVKCLYAEDNGYGVFGLKDIQTQEIYILGEITPNSK